MLLCGPINQARRQCVRPFFQFMDLYTAPWKVDCYIQMIQMRLFQVVSVQYLTLACIVNADLLDVCNDKSYVNVFRTLLFWGPGTPARREGWGDENADCHLSRWKIWERSSRALKSERRRSYFAIPRG